MDQLRSRGFRVYACGHEPVGPGVANADQFFQVDILDIDAVAELAASLGVDFVYSVGSDMAMPTVAAVSARLGLPGFHNYETTELLHRKVLLRTFLNDRGLSPVDFRVVQSAGDLTGFSSYPAIVKPSDSQGQRGISVVADKQEASAAVQHAVGFSRTGQAVIETLLEGPEVSVHVFVVDGEVEFRLPSDRFVWDGPLTGIPCGHRLPAHFVTAEADAQIERLIVDVVDALAIGTGPLYFQLILTSDGPRIIEIAPRLDGCHLWLLIKLHTGFDILDRCLGLLSGETWVDVPGWDDSIDHVLNFYLSPPKDAFEPEQWNAHPGLTIHQEFQVEPGERPRNINGVVSRVGFDIVEIS